MNDAKRTHEESTRIGGGQPYGGYYDHDPYSYYGCYYGKAIDDLDTRSLENPVGWDVRWGPWEGFVIYANGVLQQSPGSTAQPCHPG